MRLLSLFAALTSALFLTLAAPTHAATLIPFADGTVDYNVDLSNGFGDANGPVFDGSDTFDLNVSLVFDPSDPYNTASGFLLITDSNFDVVLDGVLAMVGLDGNDVVMLFDTLLGSAAGLFSGPATVRFSGFDWDEAAGPADVAVYRVAPIPLPATALLLLSGMAGIMVMTRRRKAA